jgi:hypothetical protein
MQYGSLYYRPADLSNVTMKLVKCGGMVRHGLCLYNRTEVLEACKPLNRKLRLAQKPDPPATSHGKLAWNQSLNHSSPGEVNLNLGCA